MVNHGGGAFDRVRFPPGPPLKPMEELTPTRDRYIDAARNGLLGWCVGILSVIALIIHGLYMFYYGGHLRFVSWYTPVTPDGAYFAPQAIPSERATTTVPANAVLDEVQWWLHDVRAYSSDEAAEQGQINRVAARITGDASTSVRREFTERKKAVESNQLSLPIDFRLNWLRQESNTVYLAGWTEMNKGPDGRTTTTRYTGEVDVMLAPPTDETKLLENPLGFYVTGFRFGVEG